MKSRSICLSCQRIENIDLPCDLPYECHGCDNGSKFIARVIKIPTSSTSNQEIVNGVNESLESGKMTGIIAIVKNKDGSCEFRWSKDIPYMDAIGMLETMKQDIYMRTNKLI